MFLSVSHPERAYEPEAKAVLKPLATGLHELARSATEQFYDSIESTGSVAEIIRRLRPDEYARLKLVQTDYLRMLLSENLTLEAHQEASEKAGAVHTLSSVDMAFIADTYRFYERAVLEFLKQSEPHAHRRETAMAAISERFLLDIATQIKSSKCIVTAVAGAFTAVDRVVNTLAKRPDLIRETLKIIGDLPGCVAAFFARADEDGILQIEHFHTDVGAAIHRAIEVGEAPRIRVDGGSVLGQSPAGTAWRTGKILKSDAWLVEADKKPWRALAERLGIRSSASVPLLDEHRRTIGLVSLYSRWPAYFSTDIMSGFLRHLQHALGPALEPQTHERVVPLRDQQGYQSLLAEKGVIMHYQPIICLQSGALAKVEGLARLQQHNGELVPPAKFLPALGQDELLELFTQGLAQLCRDLTDLEARGLKTKASINLPAEGLEDPRYEKVFVETLMASKLSPDRLQVEILEHQEVGNKVAVHKAFIERLKGMGVSIAQDDLGSGHSSLLRLDQYPFDELKIDQGLVRSALSQPKRAVDFIMHLTRLAHAFNTKVTVEGLENVGMIEAAAILGAEYGQGYGIAKPMPVDQLDVWHAQHSYELNTTQPKTALGTMAAYMLLDLHLSGGGLRQELNGPWMVLESFVQRNGLRNSTLGRLLEKSRQAGTAEAAALRSELLRELTNYWLKEVGA